MFEMHPRLQQDCIDLGRLPLCRLLLMNDANYPWVILVPARENITEVYQLSPQDRAQLQEESAFTGERLMQSYQGDKLNVAALGNVVPQLHIHHIVRFKHDACWPAPVWGRIPAQAYAPEALAAARKQILEAVTGMLQPSS